MSTTAGMSTTGTMRTVLLGCLSAPASRLWLVSTDLRFGKKNGWIIKLFFKIPLSGGVQTISLVLERRNVVGGGSCHVVMNDVTIHSFWILAVFCWIPLSSAEKWNWVGSFLVWNVWLLHIKGYTLTTFVYRAKRLCHVLSALSHCPAKRFLCIL